MSLAEVIRPRQPEILANTPVILAVFPVPDHPGRCVALMEDEFWHTREHARAFRYGVVCMAGEVETSYSGTDSLRDAQALAWHLSEPMPTFTEDAPERRAVRLVSAHLRDVVTATQESLDAERQGVGRARRLARCSEAEGDGPARW